MTDRELLELAAKAAGLVVWQGEWPQDYMLFASPQKADTTGTVTGVEWNPLTDDGDALRLAVKLNLTIYIECERCGVVSVEWGHDSSGNTQGEIEQNAPEGGDDYAATRRAIVRAAAEIGKQAP